VTPHYDPLIAKLIVSGETRPRCLARAKRAIGEYRVQGISTTLPFFERLLSDERFVSGEMDVGFVDRHWMEEMASRPVDPPELLPAALAAAAAACEERESVGNSAGERAESPSPWKLAGMRELMRGKS
jgi:acetyl/propionyl-CoA carboxylase alpha subunit